MEAVLIRRAGQPDLVRIGGDDEPRAYVETLRDGAGCTLDLYNQHDRRWAGWVGLGRDGDITACSLKIEAEAYWRDMTWFGWLKDMAEEAGLDLDPA